MDTIAAIATPAGGGGIGIVRLSGYLAIPIARGLFRHSGKRHFPEWPESHRLYHGYIVSPDSRRFIDEVLLAIMRAPHSYTREDVVEIQAHGGRVVLSAILDAVLVSGARLADPGEFTRRAFVNGRIDLTQAEAVADVINAQSERALVVATGQLRGDMGRRLQAIRLALEDLLGRVEAAIDFSQDAVEEIDPGLMAQQLETEIIAPLSALSRRCDQGRFLREGLRLAVVGRPNVGKSSLMNALLEEDRAIVSHIPGTTRDVIEAPLCIDGIPMILLDTAGLHKAEDPVEAQGVTKTRQALDSADLVLLVIDGSQPLTSEDVAVYSMTRKKTRIIVVNKWDLVQGGEGSCLEKWRAAQIVRTSALYGNGIDQLKNAIIKIAGSGFQDAETILPNLRQHQGLRAGLVAAQNALSGIKNSVGMELIAIDLQDAHRAMGDVIGDQASPNVLDRIFSQFCIGK